MRGAWGGGDSHGNFRPLLTTIRVMEQIRKGQTPNSVILARVSGAYPDYFKGKNGLTEIGKELLEHVIQILPCAVSSDGIEYLRRRT